MFLTENVTEAVAETVEAVSSKISLGEAGVYGLLGYAVVFFGLVLLMLVIMALGKAFSAKEKQALLLSYLPLLSEDGCVTMPQGTYLDRNSLYRFQYQKRDSGGSAAQRADRCRPGGNAHRQRPRHRLHL